MKYEKYNLELWIPTELAPENRFFQSEMKIMKEIVLHRPVNKSILRFVSHHENVRLP